MQNSELVALVAGMGDVISTVIKSLHPDQQKQIVERLEQMKDGRSSQGIATELVLEALRAETRAAPIG